MLEVRDVTVVFGDTTALDDVSLVVEPGTVTGVLGPSGCGKTTLLRVIAGLQAPDRGAVAWMGQPITGTPAHRRGFGLMFQDYALFPHLDVTGNVAFGLRMKDADPAAARRRVDEVLGLVGLVGAAHRPVGSLSGGEQQRVALARALAPEPRLLMLDEPVGALDRTLREELISEMADLFVRLDVTVLYVTHDQDEAFGLADRVVVMHRGRVVQEGAPAEVWEAPASAWIARFLGLDTILEVEVDGGIARAPWGSFPLPLPDGRHEIVLRHEAIDVEAPPPDGSVRAVVESCRFDRGRHDLTIALGDGSHIETVSDRALPAGTDVGVHIDPDGVSVLPVPPGETTG